METLNQQINDLYNYAKINFGLSHEVIEELEKFVPDNVRSPEGTKEHDTEYTSTLLANIESLVMGEWFVADVYDMDTAKKYKK